MRASRNRVDDTADLTWTRYLALRQSYLPDIIASLPNTLAQSVVASIASHTVLMLMLTLSLHDTLVCIAMMSPLLAIAHNLCTRTGDNASETVVAESHSV